VNDELIGEMKRRGIKNLWEFTEFDTWINDAERKDINSILSTKKEVFGLKLWDMKILEADQLKNASNFGVDYLFLKKDKERVMKLVKEYQEKEKQEWSMKLVSDFVNRLSKLSVHECIWV